MKVKSIKLKLIMIFSLIAILSFKNEFILISKARETKTYDPVVRAMVTIQDIEDITDELSNYSIEELQQMYNEITRDIDNSIDNTNYNMSQYVQEIDEDEEVLGDIGDANNIKEYLKTLIDEKERVQRFNSVLDEVHNINTREYSLENINELDNLKTTISTMYGNNEYWRHVESILGKTLITNITQYTEGETEADRLCDYIDDKIEQIQSHRLEIPHGETQQVPITINPDTYDPSQGAISDQSWDWLVIRQKLSIILGFIRNISVVVAVISLMIIGIKYILGSVEEKANYKQTMIPWIIGVLLVTSGTILVSSIFNIFK